MGTTISLPLLARQCARDLRVHPTWIGFTANQERAWWVDRLLATKFATAPDTIRPLVEQWRDLDRMTIAELIAWCDCAATEGEPCTA